MIDDAIQKKTAVEVQARQYEGLTVWVNALIAGAGGQIVNQAGDVKVNDTAKTAAEIISKLGKSSAAPPGMSTNAEDQARQGFESGRSYYQVNYPFVYPSAAAVGKDFQKNMGWARYPRTRQGQAEPAAARRDQHRRLEVRRDAGPGLRGGRVHRQREAPGRSPPSWAACRPRRSRSTTPSRSRRRYPFADLLRQSIEAAAPRPVTPAYSDISLAIQKTYSPPDGIDPERDRAEAEGPDREGGRREDLLMEAAKRERRPPSSPPRRPRSSMTDRAKAERKLAWMLCAPAVIVMLLVTGYPIAYALYLSLQRYDLRFPDDKEFVGLSQLRRRAHLEHLVGRRLEHRGHHRGLGVASSSCSAWRSRWSCTGRSSGAARCAPRS